MKRLFVFLACLMSLAIFSCSDSKNDDDDQEKVYLNLSTPDLVFEASGGNKEFYITCNGDWNIVCESQWCKTDVVSGNGDATVNVSTDIYGENQDRNTNLTIKSGDKTQVLLVTQKHGDALSITKDKFNFSQEGGDFSVEIKSNINVEPTIPSKFQNWIHSKVVGRSLATSNLHFTVDANEELEKREGYILIKGNTLTDTVYVFQSQKDQLILTEDSYYIPAEGKDITVELKTNIDYDITIPEEVKSWINQVTSRASRVDQLKFHIATNTEKSRTAKILIKDKNSQLSDTLYITQGGTEDYTGDVILKTEEEIKTFAASKYKRIYGNLTIENSSISSLSIIDNTIEEITGNLTIKCLRLENFDGLYSLKKIGGDFNVSDCYIKDFEGLNSLEEIGGSFILYAHETIRTSTNWIGIFENIESFRGLESLKEIGRNLRISITIDAKQSKGRNSIYVLGDLKSFEGLNQLNAIGENLEFILRFDILKNDPNSWTIFSNEFTSFKGFDNLEMIEGDLEISWDFIEWEGNSGSYKAIDRSKTFSTKGLESLRTLGGKLNIPYGEMKTYEGLTNLTTYGGKLELDENTKNEFSLLTEAQSININLYEYRNNGYYSKYPNGLSSLKNVEDLYISYASGTSIKLFKNKITITGEFSFYSGDITDLNPLNDFIASLGTSCTISYCSKLYDFTPLKTLLINFNGDFSVTNCGYNPTKYQILNGQGKPQE